MRNVQPRLQTLTAFTRFSCRTLTPVLEPHCVQLHVSGAGRNIHSRHIAKSAAMMTGPTNKPMRPNAASPPKMPTNAN
jgi:hypothetical protein